MAGWKMEPTIKHEAELDPQFPKEIASKLTGDKFHACIQCGTCSGTCPLSIYMDLTPRKVIAMTRAGFKDEVLRSFTIWLCASCYSCTVECPKQIKITELMYALKQRALADKVYPKRFLIPVLAREFFNIVRGRGRNDEGQLIVRMYLKTNPFRMILQGMLGLRLFLKGRMEPFSRSIRGKKELEAILGYVETDGTAK